AHPRNVTPPTLVSYTAPTDTVFATQAGAAICVADPLLPEEAITVTPRLFNASMAAAKPMVKAVALSHAPLQSAEVPKLMFTTRPSGWVMSSQLSPEITCAELANLP